MLVFTSGDGARWHALRVDAKSALPLEDVVVVAGRVGASPRQLTCLGGRVKPSPGARLLLVLPLAPGHDATGPAIHVLEVGECAVQLLRDVKACFPSLVRRNPLADLSDSESDSDDAAAAPSRKRRKDETAATPAVAATAQETAEFLAATRVRVLPSLAALREAYAFESAALAQAVARDAEATSACAQFLCLECPRSAPTDTPPTQLNVGVVFAHAAPASPWLEIALPREPRGVFSDEGQEEGEEHVVFQDATVYTLGAKRESSAHGGGKTVEETVQNIRLRHASGTFCSLVLPTLAWRDVVAKYGAAVPQLAELRGELRARRFMGVVPNRPVTIVLEESPQ